MSGSGGEEEKSEAQYEKAVKMDTDFSLNYAADAGGSECHAGTC